MATEFIKMLRQYGVKVSNILQRNKKIVLPTKTAFGTDNIIHPFFPFEPYTLAVSSRFVKQHYNVWAKPPDTGSYPCQLKMLERILTRYMLQVMTQTERWI